MIQGLTLRDASGDDLAALSAMRPSEVLHRDRLDDAGGAELRYLVVEQDDSVVAFGLLVFKQPEGWPEIKLLPKMIDLWVKPDLRSRGIGSFMVNGMERMVRDTGGGRVFVSVDPQDNQRAYLLYLRLGYQPLQSEPYEEHWNFTSSDGTVHQGYGWNIDLRKDVGN